VRTIRDPSWSVACCAATPTQLEIPPTAKTRIRKGRNHGLPIGPVPPVFFLRRGKALDQITQKKEEEMKKLIAFTIVVLSSVTASPSTAKKSGDVRPEQCREVHLAIQDAVSNEGPYKNHGQLMKAVTHLVNQEKTARNITGKCGACIKKQFARRIPPDEQEICGTDLIAQEILDYATDTFERIRNSVAPEDETEPEAEFVGNHIEVKSEKWVYVLDMAGQQVFRPVATYPLLKDSLSPEKDITPILDRWIVQPVDASTIDEAKRLAMVALGVNYMGDVAANVIPARELIASKSLESESMSYHEGRTRIMFSPVIPDEQKIRKYVTELTHGDDGEPIIKQHPVDLPPRSYETAIIFAGARAARLESTAALPPEGLRIVDSFREGLLGGYIVGRPYPYTPLTFGSFFSPEEWAFEYNAYAWQGEDFATDTTSLCPAYPEGLPCHDDYFLDFDYFRNRPLYHNLFLSEWCDLGGYSGIRGNCLDYDVVTRTCRSWQIPGVAVVKHGDLSTYAYHCPPENAPCFPGSVNHRHCDGYQRIYQSRVGVKMGQAFYGDLEACHVAMISTHGGTPKCDWGLDFYQFKKQTDLWTSLHREDDDGLGKGKLRHLFLQTCNSMGWVHEPKHGGLRIIDSQWMNSHVADGIRTICGVDGPAVGKAGAHVTGLPFFSHYHNGDSIIDSFFAQELAACDCNAPVTIAYGSTEDEAASTLFDGRFEKERAGRGFIIAAVVITPHLTQHQACCLPNDECIDVPAYECTDQHGTPKGSGTLCTRYCPTRSDLVACP
jgi:hypothetical protein